ncbi:MAG TPA: hypothetical protein ENG73_07405 [Desulfobacterales bacterium]|nr:hypothetical protein [Desulfobacterales bacterium]
MARLSYKQRVKMTKKSFAFPEKKTKKNPAGRGAYPINDEEHARAALRYGARYLSPSELARLKRKIHRKFPNIKIS